MSLIGDTSQLIAVLGGLNERVSCPERGATILHEGSQYYGICVTRCSVGHMVIHLNDRHNWSYGQIADWLETLPNPVTIDPNKMERRAKSLAAVALARGILQELEDRYRIHQSKAIQICGFLLSAGEKAEVYTMGYTYSYHIDGEKVRVYRDR